MGMFDMFTSFLNPGKGYRKAQDQLDKYYGQSQQYLQPYQQQGQQAYGALSGAMNELLNPTQLHDRWLQDYTQSEASKMAQARAMEQGNRAASSMGIMGSTPALQAMQAGSAQIGAEDQERFIERMIQQYLQGAGLAQNIYGTGAQAGGRMSENAMNMGQNAAEMAYGRQNAPGQLFNDLLKTGAYAYGASKNPWSTMGGK